MSLVQDLRFALRTLRRSSTSTIAVVLTLGLGIGGTTAIFTVVNSVLLRPLPFAGSERVLQICERSVRLANVCVASPPNVADLIRDNPVVDAGGVARTEMFVWRDGAQRVGVRGGIATPGFFTAFSTQPIAGRLVEDRDLDRGGNAVVVVSYRFWQGRLGGDPSIVGRTITLDAADVRVIGILPADAYFAEFSNVDLWKPLTASVDNVSNRSWRGFFAIVRHGAGVTAETAAAALSRRHRDLVAAFPAENAGHTLIAERLRDRLVAPVRQRLWLFQGAAVLVLLIACANVAGLLLVRGTTRVPEFAIRASLGAGHGRLVRQLLAEGLILSVAGAATGFVLAAWATRAIVALAPSDIPRIAEVSPDGTVALFTAMVALVTSIAFGVIPARRSRALHDVLRGQRSGTGHGSRARTIFVAVELALAFSLIVGAGLMSQAFWRLARWQPGIHRDGVTIAWLLAPPGTYRTTANAVVALGRAREAAAAVPGVAGAGLVSTGPLFGGEETGELNALGDNSISVKVQWFDLDRYYLDAIGLRIVRGRPLQATDVNGAPPVALVNESLAGRVFGDADPLGRTVTVQSHTADIVGVVADIPPVDPSSAAAPQIYWPIEQYPRFGAYLVVRAAPGATGIEPIVRARVTAAEAAMQISSFTTLDSYFDRELVGPRFNLAIFYIFAVIAIALASVGVYGIVAYDATARTREIGLRIALGATPGRVTRQLMAASAKLAAVGIAGGALLVFVVRTWLSHLLFGVPAHDLPTLVTAAVVFAAIALAAGFIPARRASRLDPVRALASC